MTKEEKFYDALKDIFIGAKVEGESGYINLMRIKSRYYEKGVFPKLQKDINEALGPFPEFREELFEKLYTFFSRYFSESGSIYFRYTPIHQNIYEKVYTDDKDVILFWKTHMLYYVKTDRLFKNLEVEIPRQASSDTPLQKGNTDSSPLIEGAGGVFKFFFDVSTLEHKKANEKREIIYEFKEKRNDGVIVFNVLYSERGKVTKIDDILRDLRKEGVIITEDSIEEAFRVFEKQSEVDYFINKNAKEFLQEQFNIWLYQYVFSGESEWTEKRIKQLQVLKDIAFKIIDFISQFEDELVKIWNKPKFALNSNYVITLDRIAEKSIELIEKILEHDGFENQVTEWKELGIIDDEFDKSKILENSPSVKGCPPFPSLRGDKGVFSDGVVKWYKLPYNPNLKNKARELRKAGNLSEVLFWNQVKNRKFLGLDFDRQKIIGNYIVDFYCKDLGIIIEIDGITHDGKIEYDEQRDDYLKSLGLKVIHIPDLQVRNNLSGVMEFVKDEISKHTVPSDSFLNTPNPSIRGEFKYLPIDTKYFKDLELEILGLFDDLDNSLDGWLIKSENYQALNTILAKFKERVQTIYIDPPFNKEQDADYFYSVKYKDSSWATMLENRLQLAKDWLNERGSIFVRCDYNGNWLVRPLMNEIFGEENFRNEIAINRTKKIFTGVKGYNVAIDSLFFYSKTENFLFSAQYKQRAKEQKWLNMHSPGERKPPERIIFGRIMYPPKGRHWTFIQETIDELVKKGRVRVNENIEYIDMLGNRVDGMPQYLMAEEELLDSNWTDIPGYSQTQGFPTENSEILLKRVIESTSNTPSADADTPLQKGNGDIVMDFFLGSGTTTAVAHKLGRKWIGVEMGEHFYTVVLPRMKKVLAYDKSGISREKDVEEKYNQNNAGGFFKYYELEQYEDVLRKVKYEDSNLFDNPYQDPYNQYIFMRDLKMLEALEIDYENNKVKVDLSRLYSNIDIPETLSNLLGRWIKKITPDHVEFEDGEKINLKDLDYKLVKPLIWWR